MADGTVLFSTYARLWLVSETFLHIHDVFLLPSAAWLHVQMILFTLAFAYPTRPTMAAAMLVRTAQYIVQAPHIWDSCIWALFTDVVFIGSMLLCPLEKTVHACGNLICTQMGLFYVGASFWKINTAFLNPRYSCAPIYVASLLSLLPEALTPAWLIGPALSTAPIMTITGELALGIGLLLPSSSTRRVSIVLAALLHYAIAITPYPNQVAAFGVFCVTRLFHAAPDAWTRALQESLSLPTTGLELLLKAGGAALIAASVSFTSTPGVYIDFCIPLQTALCLVGARAVTLPAPGLPSLRNGSNGSDGRSAAAGLALTVGGWSTLFITVAYVFFFQPLGLMDISATSPFSAIREHGGSNHLLMPTSLLQRWPPSAANVEAFHGGVVRIVYTTSNSMNSLYPADFTSQLRPRIVSLLEQHGHVARQFGPTVHQMLGHDITSTIPHWSSHATPPAPFPKYTVPAIQLRLMLLDARMRNESFELEYEHLPDLVGDERWRQSAVAAHVSYSEDGTSGYRRCRIQSAGAFFSRACDEDELALLPAPSGPLTSLLLKMMLWFPYPIIEGFEELPCMD